MQSNGRQAGSQSEWEQLWLWVWVWVCVRVLSYGLGVEEKNLHPWSIGEHLVDVELQGRDGVHCAELKGRVSVEGRGRREVECGCGFKGERGQG